MRFPQRWLNIAILASFLVGYLEWGGGHAAFVGQLEYQILLGAPEAGNFAHPMIGIPLVGQLLVLFAACQRTPSRRLTSIGIVLMGVLVLLLALIGIMGGVKTGLSTVPFLVLGATHFVRSRKSPAEA